METPVSNGPGGPSEGADAPLEARLIAMMAAVHYELRLIRLLLTHNAASDGADAAGKGLSGLSVEVSADSEGFSADDETLLNEGKTLPNEGKTLQNEDETLQDDGKTLPNGGKTLPNDGKSLLNGVMPDQNGGKTLPNDGELLQYEAEELQAETKGGQNAPGRLPWTDKKPISYVRGGKPRYRERWVSTIPDEWIGRIKADAALSSGLKLKGVQSLVGVYRVLHERGRMSRTELSARLQFHPDYLKKILRRMRLTGHLHTERVKYEHYYSLSRQAREWVGNSDG